MLHIRRGAIDDLQLVTKVEAECFPPLEACPENLFKERLESYPECFWLLFDDEKILGFIDGFVTDDEILTDEMFADASMHNPDGA